MENTENERLGRMGSTASVRFKPHTEYLIGLKQSELGKSRSDTIRFIVDSYFDKEIQDPELIFGSLNDTKRRVQELESRLNLMMVVLLEQTKRQIKVLPNRQAVPDDVARIEFERFLEAVQREIKNSDRGSIESMVLDIYQRSANGGN
ncbi:MAG: hypothetical protein MJ181_12005 [Treponema sp.]|nr:hypothetical protein [Treponema sp.]